MQLGPKSDRPAASSHCTVLYSQRHQTESQPAVLRSSDSPTLLPAVDIRITVFGGKCLLLWWASGKAVITCCSSKVSVRRARRKPTFKHTNLAHRRFLHLLAASSSDSFERERVSLRLESVFACGTADWGIHATCAEPLYHKRLLLLGFVGIITKSRRMPSLTSHLSFVFYFAHGERGGENLWKDRSLFLEKRRQKVIEWNQPGQTWTNYISGAICSLFRFLIQAHLIWTDFMNIKWVIK